MEISLNHKFENTAIGKKKKTNNNKHNNFEFDVGIGSKYPPFTLSVTY